MKINRKIKITSIVLISVLALFFIMLITLPFIFKDEIIQKVKLELNSKFDAKINFSDANLSFIRNFPYASLELQKFEIVGIKEFKKDTLLKSENINLIINIKSIFSDQGYDIRKLAFNQPKVYIKVLADGRANWKIIRKDTTQTDSSKLNFHWKLKEFIINSADITWDYQKSNMIFTFKNLNHTTTGDLTADSSLLVTNTDCEAFSFIWDGFAYISNAKANLKTDINANINQWKFTFGHNESCLNDLPFSMTGWLQSVPEGWDMDFKLISDKINFKSVLSVFPPLYSKSFSQLKADGIVNFSGFLKGKYTDDYFPAFNLKLNVVNGWFKYPDLPRPVEKINISAKISNPGKTLDDTEIDISKFGFLIANHPFLLTANIKHPMSDWQLILNASGKLNMGLIQQIYPLSEDTHLNGILQLDMKLAGQKSDFINNHFNKYQFTGNLNAENIEIKTPTFNNQIQIKLLNLVFKNESIQLKQLQANVGKNSFVATGSIQDFLPYYFDNKSINGNLNLNSAYLNLNDFIQSETNNKSKSGTDVSANIWQLPQRINFAVAGNFDKIIFQKMTLTDATGKLNLSDNELRFNNMLVNAFGGSMMLNGFYNTADSIKSKAGLDIIIKQVDFNQIVTQVETLQKIAPVFSHATGRFSSKISYTSWFNHNFDPELNTLNGYGSLETHAVTIRNNTSIEALAKALKKDNILPATINDLKILFEFKDGKLITKPFGFKIADFQMTAEGVTGTDKSIDYKGLIKLPEKYNLGKFSTINYTITGNLNKPKIGLDLKNTATEIINGVAKKAEEIISSKTQEVTEKILDEAQKQKDKAIDEAHKKAEKIINDAEIAGNKLMEQAQIKAQELINKATNPLTKAAATIAAKKIVDEAKKQALILKEKAQNEADKVIQEASDNVVIEKK